MGKKEDTDYIIELLLEIRDTVRDLELRLITDNEDLEVDPYDDEENDD